MQASPRRLVKMIEGDGVDDLTNGETLDLLICVELESDASKAVLHGLILRIRVIISGKHISDELIRQTLQISLGDIFKCFLLFYFLIKGLR